MIKTNSPGRVFKGRTENSRDDWETPPYLFKLLDDEFHFSLDPCASIQNHKCPIYYVETENGLTKDWAGQTVFVNPPFLHKDVWIEKCYQESLKPNTTVVLLIPASTETNAWHRFVMNADEIRLCYGRINFLVPVVDGGKEPINSAFSPVIVVFRPRQQPYLKVTTLLHKKQKPRRVFK